MSPSKRKRKKIFLNSHLCRMLGIISDQEHNKILNNLSTREH